jgi:hypothetical protein
METQVLTLTRLDHGRESYISRQHLDGLSPTMAVFSISSRMLVVAQSRHDVLV